MDESSQVETVVISAPLTPLYRSAIRDAASSYEGLTFQFELDGDSTTHRLDGALTASIAAAVLQFVSIVMQWQLRPRAPDWSLERVEATVREEAAKAFGIANPIPVRYQGLRAFLDGTVDRCGVVAEHNDEDYLFIVDRTGATISIRMDGPAD